MVRPYVKILKYSDDWILGLSLQEDETSILFINVYLPYAALHNDVIPSV